MRRVLWTLAAVALAFIGLLTLASLGGRAPEAGGDAAQMQAPDRFARLVVAEDKSEVEPTSGTTKAAGEEGQLGADGASVAANEDEDKDRPDDSGEQAYGRFDDDASGLDVRRPAEA
ncbi:MAG: hypothetical protein KC613_26435, partial [Myxococcales bacterium]|nr:hypothetical protein [Myxococcales bacterium]